jgi:hypothetical protein
MAGSSSSITAALLPQVRPGDLITAELMNGVVDLLQDLETRIAALETAGGTRSVTITAVTGTTVPVRSGTRATAIGTNFARPAILNTVTIDGAPVTAFSTIESTDTRLVFDVPQVPGLPQEGRPARLVVSNANGVGTFDFTLAPKEQGATGNSEVSYAVAPILPAGQSTVALGQSYVFTYKINAFASAAANYLVQPTISGAAGWTAQVLPDNGDQPTDGIVNIPGAITGSSKDVRIRVTLPASGGAGTLNVAVTSPENPRINPGFASPITIAPGAPPPTPDNRVRMSLAAPAPGPGGRIVFPRGQATPVTVSVAVTQQGTYNVSAAMRNAAGWTDGGLDTTQFQVKTDPPPGQPANQPISASFTAGASATATDLIFTVTRGSDVNVQFAVPVTVPAP